MKPDQNPVRERESSAPLDHTTIGHFPFLNAEDLEGVLAVTGLELLPEIDAEKFRYWINHIVDWTIREQLTIRLDRKTFEKLKKSIEAYTDLSRSLLHSEYPPPCPPIDWLREVEDWIAAAESMITVRSPGGAASNKEKIAFVPKALGLFHAGFGVDPDNTVSMIADDERGAAFRFIRSISNVVRREIDDRRFSDRIDLDLQSKARWLEVSEDAVRKRIEAALELRLETIEWWGEAAVHSTTGKMGSTSAKRSGLAWQLYSRMFRKYILSS